MWYNNPGLKDLRGLPCIICWGIWLARNSPLFEDKIIPPFQIISQAGGHDFKF
jgi:hypothetical protein